MLPVDAARTDLNAMMRDFFPGLGCTNVNRLLDGFDALIQAHLREQANPDRPLTAQEALDRIKATAASRPEPEPDPVLDPPPPALDPGDIDLREHPEWRKALANVMTAALVEIRSQTRGGQCRDPELVNRLADAIHCLSPYILCDTSLFGTTEDPRAFSTDIMRASIAVINADKIENPHRTWVRTYLEKLLPGTP